MRRYANEADYCLYCGSTNLRNELVQESVTDSVQLAFECNNCGSTWDVVYKALYVINEHDAREKEGQP